MGQFFKFTFASCLGVILATLLMGFLLTLFITGSALQSSKPVPVAPNSVLHLRFNQAIPELTNNLEAQPLPADLKSREIIGLHDMIHTLEYAATDDHIKGIFLEVDPMYSRGFATARNLRQAILDFRESGKFVVAHAKIYTQGTYYLASSADEVYVNPLGLTDIRGFAAEIPFYKTLLDRLGVHMQIYYAGKFKSATEPYRRTSMSPESKTQVREFLNDFYDLFLDDVEASRKMERAQLKAVIDEYLAYNPEKAVELGLMDGLARPQEMDDLLRKKLGLDPDKDIPLVTLANYYQNHPPKKNYQARDKIAVLYAEGAIIDGEGTNGATGDSRYLKAIRQIERDDRIKAVVLRVNSPGGSALASENIWYSLQRLKESGLPLIVSMGDYAASGGYYIACLGDSIFAEPNTLTGSIGVFRLLPSFEETLENEVGIAFDSVKTSPSAIGFSPFFDLSPAEARKLQLDTESTYATFLQRVADGRGMSVEAVTEVAQGRVWTGKRAISKGLVDRLGVLDEAIASAAKMADLEEYRISEYPRIKDPFTQFLEDLLGTGPSTRLERIIQHEMPDLYPHYRVLRDLKSFQGTQALMLTNYRFE